MPYMYGSMASTRLLSLLMLTLFFAVAVAGCLGGDDDDADNSDPAETDGDETEGETDEGETEEELEPGTLTGVVADVVGPVEGAKVSLIPSGQSAETDSEGRFNFDEVAPGTLQVSVAATYYLPASEQVVLDEGGTESQDFQLELQMIPDTDVPLKYAKIENYVTVFNPLDPDILIASAGVPGAAGPEFMVTNMTKNNTFPGFWELEPLEDYRFARFDAVLYRFDADMLLPEDVPDLPEEPPRSELGLRYFRGEDLVENEIVQGEATEYHTPDPVQALDFLWVYQFENDDWEAWGDRNWQIGVTANDTDGLPLGAGVAHLILINALLVDEEYAEAVA